MTAGGTTLGIVGTGTMGRGIAQLAACAGLTVLVFDQKPDRVIEARAAIQALLARQVGKGVLTAARSASVLEAIRPLADLRQLAGCDIVVESIVEDLAAKRTLLCALEEVVAEDCILATNTSSLSVTAVSARCRLPRRVAGWHFFNPVPLMRMVEVVGGELTDPAVTRRLAELSRAMGHAPVTASDSPGFIVNHAGRAFSPEAFRILNEGIATVGDIDAVMREAAGFRMGPFELVDMIGLDVAEQVIQSFYEQYQHEPRFRPSPLIARRVAAGLLGRKSGRGFYAYDKRGQRAAAAPEPAAPPPADCPVWVSPAEPQLARRLKSALEAEGHRIVAAAAPPEDALILVTPLGIDVTRCTHEQGLDARRTVGVDALLPLDRRRTLMTSPATQDAWRDAAHGLLAAAGVPVTVIRDSPGFIAQRFLALIVAIGCDMAQQRIAEPADIDRAVELALGYPKGPLAWGDALGPANVVRILQGLERTYGDPRYRPSPWLERRALLGLSLLQPG